MICINLWMWFLQKLKNQDLCELEINAKTDNQLVQLSYMIFQKTGVFINTLTRWNERKGTEDNPTTFTAFKSHMHTEHRTLKTSWSIKPKQHDIKHKSSSRNKR